MHSHNVTKLLRHLIRPLPNHNLALLLWFASGLVWGDALQHALSAQTPIPAPIPAPIPVYAALPNLPPGQALDIVFAPADDIGDLGTQAARRGFRDRLRTLIEAGILKNNVFESNRALFNFWYTLRAVRLDHKPACAGIDRWDFAGLAFKPDAILILHASQRVDDCAVESIGTAEIGQPGSVLHELGHALFHLPDEYWPEGVYDIGLVLQTDLEGCREAVGSADYAGACAELQSCRKGVPDPGPVTTLTPYYLVQGCRQSVMSSAGYRVLDHGPADWRQIYERTLAPRFPLERIHTPQRFARQISTARP